MTKSIINRIEELGLQARDSHNDGFTSYGAKQELYKIKWAIEKEINNAPVFVGEEYWIMENRK